MKSTRTPVILPDKFRDKSVSLMHCTSSNGAVIKVALVEALVQVCFHNISADQFVDALLNLFNISLEGNKREKEIDRSTCLSNIASLDLFSLRLTWFNSSFHFNTREDN